MVKYIYMKMGILLSVWCCFFAGSCTAQTAPVKIQVLSSSTREVKYSVTNNGPQTCYYYISLEQSSSNKWEEIALDIDNTAPEKAAVIRKLAPKKNQTDIYLLKNIPVDYQKKGTAFRFKVTYGPAPDKTSAETWSENFSEK